MFDEKGNVIPVTLLEAGPCEVTQIKKRERDSYEAIQVGFIKKTKKIKKTEKGKEFKHLKEFKVRELKIEDWTVGKKIDASVFKKGDLVKVSGISKGKGFAGVVKRWGFHGKDTTHGVKHEMRTPGSVGARTPSRVVKGRKMPGRMGGDKVTIKNLKVIKADPENNLIVLQGGVPGRKGTLVEIRG